MYRIIDFFRRLFNLHLKFVEWFMFGYAILLFGFVCFLTHYNFRTWFWDLGAHCQAMYEYSQGQLARFPGNPNMYMLGDHFSLTLIVYSLFFPLFDSYTPILLDFFSVLIGGYGILCYLKRLYPREKIYSPWILFYFFTNWGLISAVAFTFHNNVVPAMLIPWIALFYREKRWLKFYLVLIWMLASQENIAFYNFMLLLSLLVDKIVKSKVESAPNLLSKIQKKLSQVSFAEILPMLICLSYFLFLITYVLPHLHSFQITGRYAHWGTGVGEIVKNILFEPWRIIEPYKKLSSDQVRGTLDGLGWVLLSGIFLPFIRPVWLIALIGYTAQRYLADFPNFWSEKLHYSVELAPFLSLVLIDVIHHYNSKNSAEKILAIPKYKNKILITLTILCISSGIAGYSNNNIGRRIRENLWIYRTDALERKGLIEAMNLVPDNEPLVTQARITPHLMRRWAGQKLDFNDSNERNLTMRANYMLLAAVPALIDTVERDTVRIPNRTYRTIRELRTLIQDSNFQCIYHNNKNVYLLKRKIPVSNQTQR